MSTLIKLRDKNGTIYTLEPGKYLELGNYTDSSGNIILDPTAAEVIPITYSEIDPPTGEAGTGEIYIIGPADATEDAGTVFLMHSDTTDGSTTFTDESANSHTPTVVTGSVTHSTTQQKFGSTSLSFSSSKLRVASHTDFNLGTSPFTIDCWIYPQSGAYGIYEINEGNQASGHVVFIDSGVFYFRCLGQQHNSISASSYYDTWTHVAGVRNGADMKMYFNGTLVATLNVGAGASIAQGNLMIGGYSGSGTMLGYIDEFRLVKGEAKWTENFTPPTSPYTFSAVTTDVKVQYADGTKESLLPPDLTPYVQTSDKGVANGVAELDASTKVPLAQMPDGITGALNYIGTWNASTNTPDISATSPTAGDYYKVSVAGSTDLSGITDWDVADWAIYSGSVWQKIDNSEIVNNLDINSLTEKASPVSADILVIEDSADSNNLKKVQMTNLPGGSGTDDDAIHDNVAAEISAVTEKASPVSADLLLIEDSAATNAKKRVEIGNLPFIDVSDKGANSGVAELDANGTVPVAQIPGTGGFTGTLDAPLALQQQNSAPSAAPSYGKLYTTGTGDPIDSYTKLLIHSDTTNGSTTYTDSSATGHTVTPLNGPTHSTTQQKFGASSMLFDGTDDHLSLDNHADWDLGDEDWTIECWVYFSTAPNQVVIFDRNYDEAKQYQLYFTSTTSVTMYTSYDGTNLANISWTITALTSGVWYHLAVERYGDTMELYIDGTGQNSQAFTTTIYDGNTKLSIGAQSDDANTTTSWELDGYIDEFRLTKGLARYQNTNFTPETTPFGDALVDDIKFKDGSGTEVSLVPASSYDSLTLDYQSDAPSPTSDTGSVYIIREKNPGNDANTTLLIHSDTTNGSTTFADSSSSDHTVTGAGSLDHSTTEAKFGASSIAFPLTGTKYVNIAASTAHDLDTSAWTVDFWAYFDTKPTAEYLMTKRAADAGWWFTCNTTPAFTFAYYGSSSWSHSRWNGTGGTTAFDPSVDTWHHIAVERYNGYVYLYLNGTSLGGIDISGWTLTPSTNDLQLGSYSGDTNYPFDGYMDEIRFSDSARYQGTGFSVETVAYDEVIGQQATFKYHDGTTIPLNNIVYTSDKGVANGVAELDATTKVPLAQMPDGIAGGLNYLGTWDANANTPEVGSLYDLGSTADTFTETLSTGTTSDIGGTQYRLLVPAADISTDGARCRITFKAGTGGAYFAQAYIGKKASSGDAWDYDGNQKQITFNGGSTSVTIPQNTSETSDWIAFPIDEAADYFVSYDTASANDCYLVYENSTTINAYYKATATLESHLTAPDGYSSINSRNYGLEKIEIQTFAAGGPSNGDYYKVNTAGTTDVGGIDDWGVADWLIFNGVEWQKIDNSEIVNNLDIDSLTEKTTPVSADILIIEDSADSNNLKKVQMTNLPGGADSDAIHDNVAGEISTVTEKTTPVSADLLLIEDSAASNVKKSIQIGNLPIGTIDSELLLQRQLSAPTETTGYGTVYVSGGPADYTTDTLVLIESDTTNASTVFTDDSSSGRTITEYGNTQHSTTQQKFGATSIYFDGTGDYLTLPDSTDWAFGTDEWCFDFWMYPTSVTGTRGIIGFDSTDDAMTIGMINDDLFIRFRSGDEITGTDALTINTWQHVAVERVGNTVTAYVDGTSIGTQDVTGVSWADDGNGMYIGRWYTTVDNYYYAGYLDEIRFSDTYRFNGTFIPETAPYTTAGGTTQDIRFVDESGNETILLPPGTPDSVVIDYQSEAPSLTSNKGKIYIVGGTNPGNDANTTLLIKSDTTNGSTTFTDSSSSDHTVTGAGSIAHSTAQAKFGASSIAFPLTGTKYITIAASTLHDLDTSAWTVDFWAYFDTKPSSEYLATKRGATEGWYWSCDTTPACYFSYYASAGWNTATWDGTGGTTAFDPSLDTWHHVALERYNGDVYLYIDGSLLGGIDMSGWTLTPSTNALHIGSYSGDTNYPFDGYMDEIRFSNSARYQGTSFSVQTVEYGGSLGQQATLKYGDGTTYDLKAIELSDYSQKITPIDADTMLIEDSEDSNNTKYIELGDIPLGAQDSVSINHTESEPTNITDIAKLYVDGEIVGSQPTEVSLLVHSNTTNGSTTFTDSSSYEHTITRTSMVHSTTQSKFGTSSIAGGSSHYLTMPTHAGFNFGTGDLTIDFWAYFTDGTSDQGVFQVGSYTEFSMWIYNGNFNINFDGTTSALQVTNTSYINGWHHYAIVRNGAALDLYIDGTSVDTGDVTSDDIADGTFILGYYYGTTYNFAGYIDEFRVVKGEAKYTTSFTPRTQPYGTPETDPQIKIVYSDGTIKDISHIPVISSDTTVYVASTGNDTSGDGSSGTPYATPQKVLEVYGAHAIDSSAWLKIHIKDHVALDETWEIKHPYGDRIQIEGETALTRAFTAVSTSGSSGNYTVTLTMADTSGITVGDYAIIKGLSGGTNMYHTYGCWEITAVTTDTSIAVKTTIQTSDQPSGAVAGDALIMTSSLDWSGNSGTVTTALSINNGKAIGNIQNIVLLGDSTGSSYNNTILVQANATLSTGTNFGIAEGGDKGIQAATGASVNVHDAVISGCRTEGLDSNMNASVNGIDMVLTGNYYGAAASYTGFLQAWNVISVGNVYGLRAQNLSMIRSNTSGSIVAGNTTNFDPSSNTEGNVLSYILW